MDMLSKCAAGPWRPVFLAERTLPDGRAFGHWYIVNNGNDDGRIVCMASVWNDDEGAMANAHMAAASFAMYTALEPFAAFLDAIEHLGRPFPQTGPVYSVATKGGQRDLTVEDFKRARDALNSASVNEADMRKMEA